MSKRVRKAVNYAEPELSDDEFGAVEEVPEEQPKPKRRKIGSTSFVPAAVASTSVTRTAAVPAVKKQKKEPKGKKNDETLFDFLKLPGEIRNMIYEYAFISDKQMSISRWPADDSEGRDCQMFTGTLHRHLTAKEKQKMKKQKDAAFNLLHVCKQIDDEATPFLYNRNSFHFSFHEWLTAFIAQYPIHVPHLRDIWVWFRIDNRRGLATDVQAILYSPGLADLERMTVLVYTSAKALPEAAEQFYAVARNWIQAVGERKGDESAALDILNVEAVMYRKCRGIWLKKMKEFRYHLEYIMAENLGHLASDSESGADNEEDD
ncbi:hypothetical protein BU23DRAFT_595677 [Bimuria novae-zelandiae CBS 107.79]|uniref:DUF7730 domain-containing protein n=1 Tax=Bimuria novae-zelandiae CBS 107.79 TaxID=1447943 RepID=A0A6A5VMM0_9PLEO|nr:hypothetical protein BU23DRAFT_595677 [Bimuria novae-zelandiae CBS 107.79]